MSLYALTEADVATLRELVSEYRNGRLGTKYRATQEQASYEGGSEQPPDVYIVKPQTSDGIPALSGTEPGYALCDVYRVIFDSENVPRLVKQDFTKYVYNIADTDLPQDYLLASRDKYERWVAPVGGGSTEVVSFILRSDLLEGSWALAEKTVFRAMLYDCDGYTAEDYVGTSGTGVFTARKSLCFCDPRTFFIVFDRLNEFTGSMDLHCGIAHRLSDTPTKAEYCIDSGIPDVAALRGDDWLIPDDAVWDDRLWEIQRIVCANFLGCGCQNPDVDPCAQEPGT